MRPLLDAGARGASSPQDAVRDASFVITMLPSSQHVLDATTGRDGVLAAASPGTVLIDMSTINPMTSRNVATAARARGVEVLDAPVSGSGLGTADGSLTVMVGGSAEVLDRSRELLSVPGARIIHCGGSGTGSTVKPANQVMAATSMVAVAESFRLGQALGVDPRLLYDVSTTRSGDSWSLRTRPPVPGVLDSSPADHCFRPGFKGDLMRKDLDLALGAAASVGLDLPLASAVHDLYARLGTSGLGDRDFSAVIDVLPRRADGS